METGTSERVTLLPPTGHVAEMLTQVLGKSLTGGASSALAPGAAGGRRARSGPALDERIQVEEAEVTRQVPEHPSCEAQAWPCLWVLWSTAFLISILCSMALASASFYIYLFVSFIPHLLVAFLKLRLDKAQRRPRQIKGQKQPSVYSLGSTELAREG